MTLSKKKEKKINTLLRSFSIVMKLYFPRKTLSGKNIFSQLYFQIFFSPSSTPVSYHTLSICFQLFVVQVALYELVDCKPVNLLAWPIKCMSHDMGFPFFMRWQAPQPVFLMQLPSLSPTGRPGRRQHFTVNGPELWGTLQENSRHSCILTQWFLLLHIARSCLVTW